MEKLFDLPCLNVIWRLVCGRRFDNDDKALPKLIECLEVRFIYLFIYLFLNYAKIYLPVHF